MIVSVKEVPTQGVMRIMRSYQFKLLLTSDLSPSDDQVIAMLRITEEDLHNLRSANHGKEHQHTKERQCR